MRFLRGLRAVIDGPASARIHDLLATACPTCGHSTPQFHATADGSCTACGPRLGKRCARAED